MHLFSVWVVFSVREVANAVFKLAAKPVTAMETRKILEINKTNDKFVMETSKSTT